MAVIDPYRFAFDPLAAIPWVHAWWAEGPEFLALGLADGATVATWPDEVGTLDGTQGTAANRPTLQLASNLNGQPALRFDGVNDALNTATEGATAQPYTIVCVFRLNTYTQGTPAVGIVFDNVGSGGVTRHALATTVADTPDSWWIYSGAGAIDSGGVSNVDTNRHLAVLTFTATDTIELDGAGIASGNAGADSFTNMGIVGLGNMAPDMAFLAMINRALTADEKAALLAWSQSKYATL